MSEIAKLLNVRKIYNPGENEVVALDSVSLTINDGEFVAIVGHSGSGKSTLMNIIGCLDTPTFGEYYLDGSNVSGLSDNQLSRIRNQKIGFVFQSFNLIHGMSAFENVELPLMYRGMNKEDRRAISADALNKVGLSNRMEHMPPQMSGGQQQRVAIARAIAAEPPFILADEPTGNLDTVSGNEVMEILHNLNKDGKTIVLITHDPDIAKTASRIVEITDGKIVKDMVN